MSSKSSAIGRGILIGAAAGAALYVMWRRARERREGYEAPPMRAPQPRPEPAQEAPTAPVAAVDPQPEQAVEPVAEAEAVSEPEPEHEAVTEPEPVAEQPPEPVAEQPPEPVAEQPPDPVGEQPPQPVFEAAAPEVHPPPVPVAEHGAARRQGLTSTGRPRDLSPAGWPQPMPLGSIGAARRPTPVSARATWPGVAAAGQMRPTPFRRVAPRGGGGPLHRTG
jgi:hypothetical protein